MLRPSVQPSSLRPPTNAAMRATASGSSAARLINTPTRRIRSRCCARATSGHVAAAPPMSVMNPRRRMGLPSIRGSYPTTLQERGVVRHSSRMTVQGSQPEKLRRNKSFPLLPRKPAWPSRAAASELCLEADIAHVEGPAVLFLDPADIEGLRNPSRHRAALRAGSAVAAPALAECAAAPRLDFGLHFKTTAGPLGQPAHGFPLGNGFPAGMALESDIFGLRRVDIDDSVARHIVGRLKPVLLVEQRLQLVAGNLRAAIAQGFGRVMHAVAIAEAAVAERIAVRNEVAVFVHRHSDEAERMLVGFDPRHFARPHAY